MVANNEKTTSWGSGIEHQGIGFVTYSLRPWLIRDEQAMKRCLLTAEGRKNYYLEYNVDSLLRGDSKARGEFYKTLFMLGAISQNEIRKKENMNPIENGNIYYIPLNMADSSKEAQLALENDSDEGETDSNDDENGPNEGETDQDDTETNAYKALMETRTAALVQAVDKIVRAETRAIGRMIDKTGEDYPSLEKQIVNFYKRHKDFVNKNIRVVSDINSDEFTRNYINESLSDIREQITVDPSNLINVVDDWESNRKINTVIRYSSVIDEE